MLVNVSIGFRLSHNDSRDWAVAMVFHTFQNTRGSNVLAEVVARVRGQSEVAIDKWHKRKCFS